MGVFMSKDGGATWTSMRLSAVSGSSASAVVVDPRNANIVYVGGQRNSVAALFKSMNGGKTWENITRSVKEEVYDIGVDPKVANRVFVSTRSGIYRSVNGGTSWVRILNISGFSYRVLAFHPKMAGTIYAAGEAGVILSHDAGVTWEPLNTGLTAKYVKCLAFNQRTKVLYAGTAGGGVYKIQQ